jgi:hypothetical protein
MYYMGMLLIAPILFIYLFYRGIKQYKRKRGGRLSGKKFFHNDKKHVRVEHIIQEYTRTGSIPRVARSTGYSERKIKRILIKAGKYTTKKEAKRILAKYR